MKRNRNRFLIFAWIVTCGFLAVFFRIGYLAFGSGGGSGSARPRFIRGPIQDRRGLTLAVTEEASTIGIAPDEIIDPEFTSEILSKYLNTDSRDILKRIYLYKNRRYFLLKRQVDNFTADRLIDLNLPGVHRESEFSRHYPGESLASNLLGFVGRDQANALAGIERIYQDVLMNSPRETSHSGATLQLSIDSLIQHRLEEAMAKAFESSHSKRATGLFMDITTGELLAVANFPNFNPNQYYLSKPYQRGNWAFRLNYEPGSTVKIFMAAILLSENAISRKERFYCPGEISYKGIHVRCKANGKIIQHGNLTLDEILKYSCNVGMIKAMQRIRRDRLYYYLNQLGFGRKTGVMKNGVGETAGYLPELKNWYTAASYYVPIGQSFSVTPLQLLRAGASIAAEGNLTQPILAKKYLTESGKVIFEEKPSITQNPFPPAVNRKVLEMMRGVVTGGTAQLANLKEIRIAGKTGTGQKSSASGYGENVVSSFIGFFPADHPRYGGLIVYDEPGNLGGGAIAAPVFAEFVRNILPLLYSSDEEGVATLKSHHHDGRLSVDPERLHDFRGLSAREAISIIGTKYGLPVQLHGSGYIYRQSPRPGTPVAKIKQIDLYLDF